MNRLIRSVGVLSLCLAAGAVIGGQALQPGQDPRRPLLFQGARVIVGDGRVIDDAALLVQGGLVMDVGRNGAIPSPAGGITVTVRGKTIMPAIVNAHSHLGWEKYTSWGAQNFTRENLIDHLYRHAYYGVGTVISTASD